MANAEMMDHIFSELKTINRKLDNMPNTYIPKAVCDLKEEGLKNSIKAVVLEYMKGLVSYKQVAVVTTVALLAWAVYIRIEDTVGQKLKNTESKIIGHIKKDSTDVGFLLTDKGNCGVSYLSN